MINKFISFSRIAKYLTFWLVKLPKDAHACAHAIFKKRGKFKTQVVI